MVDVSVIFATHNREDVLEKVFEAWRKVDLKTIYTYEIICSDDQSSDRTCSIIEKVKDLPIKLIKNRKGGASKARNAALQIAQGKIIIFTGDDIFPCEDFINLHYENYLKYGDNIATLGKIDWHPDLKLNHLMKHITDIGCEQFGFIGLLPYQVADFRHFYTSNISVSMLMLKKLKFFFNTDFSKYGFEDIELGYRLSKLGLQIYYDPDILVYHYHIYNNVDKFCNRQASAGEELVEFSRMHSDLSDKCGCDVNNCRSAFLQFAGTADLNSYIKGLFLDKLIKGSKFLVRLFEKVISSSDYFKVRFLCSIIYKCLFRFYFFYGIAIGISSENKIIINNPRLLYFSYKYMHRPFSQLYWDNGYGFNEADSKKWIYWDSKNIRITCLLPIGVKSIRFSPLRMNCVAKVFDFGFILNNGRKAKANINWTNGEIKNDKFDFSKSIDPIILIKNIPKDYRSFFIEMEVRPVQKGIGYFRSVRVLIHKLKQKLIYKINTNKSTWKVDYSYGQSRRIQIIVRGHIENRKRIVNNYRNQIAVFGFNVSVIDESERPERGYSNYIYSPVEEPLDSVQFMQVVYTLMNQPYDYILVSKAYVNFPQVAFKQFGDVCIYDEKIKELKMGIKKGLLKGRFLSLPSHVIENCNFDITKLFPSLVLKNNNLLTSQNVPFLMYNRNFPDIKTTKPMVFVIPVFWAVGGVERNTVEIIKKLKDVYDFCLITLEHHCSEQGSLHHQLKGICQYVFDLKEITEYENYLNVLYELKNIFSPKLVWFCNNSPWIENNIKNIREVFRNIPLVLQDAYDTRMGWIEYYANSDINYFDHFIAVTKLIEETLIKKYNIQKEKISVIYSTVNEEKIRLAVNNKQLIQDIFDKYGLDVNKKHFAFIARLTEQKNPIRYLKLIKDFVEAGYSGVEFLLVGDGICAKEVGKFIEENSLKIHVICIPYVSDTPELISIIDGLIITSNYEGLPIVSIEAMCVGTPILTTDTGDTKRFILKNDNGQVFDERKSDLENFVHFMKQIENYKENSLKNRSGILEFFSSKFVSTQYKELFDSLIKVGREK